MSKVSAALACAGLLIAGSANALSNVGFESGDTTGWSPTIGATVQAQTSYDVNLADDISSFTYNTTITPVTGSYFGLMTLSAPPITSETTPQSSQSYTFNLSGVNAVNGDIVWVRLITADYFYTGYNDSVTLSYNGTPTDTVDTTFLSAGCNGGPGLCSPDSGWLGFALPTGTQNLAVTVTNFYDAGGINSPLVALDFTPAAVPEPGMGALSLAGLAALGLMARRRRASAASSAAA